MPHFPIDVGLLIIDQCQHDKSSLAACSLVCHAWLETSRSHLFRKIVLEGDEHVSARIILFAQIISLSPTKIGSHIKELHLRGRDIGTNLSWYIWSSSSAVLQIAAIENIIPVLPRLQILTITNIGLSIQGLTAVPAIRPSLQRLEVSSLLKSTAKVEDVVFLLLMFSSIRTLVLDLMYDNSDPVSLLYDPKHVPFDFRSLHAMVNIRSLVLHRMEHLWAKPMYDYIRKLEQPGGEPSLQCVSVWPSRGDYDLLFIQLASPSIHSLRINTMTMQDRPSAGGPGAIGRIHWGKIGIQSCTDLRALSFTLDTAGYLRGSGADAVKRAFQGALEIVQLERLPSVERVTFHLRLPSEDNPVLTVPDWEYMDQVLSYIGSLRSVVIDFAAGSVCPIERFGERMARAYEKKQLEFRSHMTEVPWWDVPV